MDKSHGIQDAMTMMVAAHKNAEVPSDDFYLPVHVGKANAYISLPFLGDDTGDSISDKNGSYCELTAQYWAWKNLNADYVGLSHYRRYFKGSMMGPNATGILSRDEAADLMRNYEIIVARPRNYVIETIESHYAHSHYDRDLSVVTRAAIESISPDLIRAFDAVLRRRSMSLFNMFLMERHEFECYSEWLFSILAECERDIDNSTRTPYEQRTFGYLGEILLNVWVTGRDSAVRVGYLPVVNTEGEPKVKKGIQMLSRKVKRESK